MVAFETDDYDERTRSGWSVLVNGRAHAIYEEAEIQRLSRLGLRPWVSAADRRSGSGSAPPRSAGGGYRIRGRFVLTR